MAKYSKQIEKKVLGHYGQGVTAPWYEPQDLSEQKRASFRLSSISSARAKREAISGDGPMPAHSVNTPKLKPESLMPKRRRHRLTALSMFSGGGGLDLGFDMAGFSHAASFEIISDAGTTLQLNRPRWQVYSGAAGDVRNVNWKDYKGSVDVVHGGPPCQPFSNAGRQAGTNDERNLFPEFIRCIEGVSPRAFLAENVPSLLNRKFEGFVHESIMKPLQRDYIVEVFKLSAVAFGVPQTRTRVFFVGIRKDGLNREYRKPSPTHSVSHLNGKYPNTGSLTLFEDNESDLPNCMDVREALGLPGNGHQIAAPTLRSGLTGPRHTTSILSSTSALKKWNALEVWPNGVSCSRDAAARFPAKNNHFRLSVDDCALLQGFPESWKFYGAVYMAIGQIGNSVVPPVAYQVAQSIARVLKR